MDLKNAVAVCLISLVSATLVLLMARALDMQAAARIEPQLERIVEQLQAIREQGGFASAPGAATGSGAMDDGLMVYYFYGNMRCPTCRSIESQSHDTVHADFASELDAGTMAWKMLNYEDASGADLGRQFEVQVPVVVLARMKDGKIAEWRRLDKVWALVGEQADFADYIRAEINDMLVAVETPDTAAIPIPESDPDRTPSPTDASDIPVPDDLPVPDDDPAPKEGPFPDTGSVPDGTRVPE
jgi:hypothetical protein